MNRDELLTRLAMDLAEWPKRSQDIFDWADGKGFSSVRDEGASGVIHAIEIDGTPIAHAEYLAERERLINKPSWDDAPEKAAAVAQNEDGKWVWYLAIPKVIGDAYWGCRAGGRHAAHGEIPAGHDWKETLEQRPVQWPSEDRIDAIGQNGPSGEHYWDDAFRECERKLREADLTRHITPAELVNRQLMQRCDELQESNARLADENQRLRRAFREYCA